MKDVKSILIGIDVHERLKNYSNKSGMKIRSLTEKAIISLIDEEEKKEVQNVQV